MLKSNVTIEYTEAKYKPNQNINQCVLHQRHKRILIPNAYAINVINKILKQCMRHQCHKRILKAMHSSSNAKDINARKEFINKCECDQTNT